MKYARRTHSGGKVECIVGCGMMSHLRQAPAVQDRQSQDLVEVVQMCSQGAATGNHGVLDPDRASDLFVHQRLAQPAIITSCCAAHVKHPNSMFPDRLTEVASM